MIAAGEPRSRGRSVAGAFVLLAVSSAMVAGAALTTVDAGRGDVLVRYPAASVPGEPAPLVILLHGYTASGLVEELFFQMGPWLEAAGFVYAMPDGTLDQVDNRFWNGTDACCDLFDTGVDDDAYLLALIEAIDGALGIDRRRVLLLGHSNGGFMAHGFACRNAEAVAGIATLAGATYQDPADCQPARDVPVLAIHGTADASIEYEGGEILGVPFPGALETVALWAADGGCSDLTTSEPPFDGHLELPGADTEVLRYDLGCGAGGAELWTIVEGEHIPPLTDELRARLRDWLAAAAQHLFSDGFETGTDAAWGP